MGYKIKRILAGTQQVRPSGWTPWSNTLAYFPLQWDWLDKVWSFTLDNTGTQQTLWRRFTSASQLNTGVTWVKTLSWWVKIASASGSSWWQCWILASYWNYVCYLSAGEWKYFYAWVSNRGYTSSSVDIIDNKWHHVVITNNWTNIIWYVDWVAYNLNTPSLTSLSKYLVFKSTNNTIDVTLSEVIYENKQRTSQEVADYYNKTKSKYWL